MASIYTLLMGDIVLLLCALINESCHCMHDSPSIFQQVRQAIMPKSSLSILLRKSVGLLHMPLHLDCKLYSTTTPRSPVLECFSSSPLLQSVHATHQSVL